ncbi:MAG: DUF1846 domain-containing protein [Ruminococcaceae bacterium]|nr:DUF1846 domain-containing protein [Oscillospiraceae bacterium]
MAKIGFDNDEYLRLQSKCIRDRISQFGGKLYLEFGGKLFDDYHASRVLPGFQPDSKIRMLCELRDEAEIVIVISADDIEKNKRRGDLGITYDVDVLRLIDTFRDRGLLVGSVVITRFHQQPSAMMFRKRLESLGIRVYQHYSIDDYPSNIPLIVSDDGFGKNDFIETERSLVIVTAPGPGSGKMAVCLSQLYHEFKRGISAGYAKFETFPIWNLPLKHPVNLAYEAATADLSDVNMIDNYHMDAYGEMAVNYNRDIEIFPVLNTMMTRITGKTLYRSPTDMGVNMVGNCIIDEAAVIDAAKREVIRRYYNTACEKRKGLAEAAELQRIELIMNQLDITLENRKSAVAARQKEAATGGAPAAAIELDDGTIITGKTTPLLGASSAVLLNTLKHFAGLADDVMLLSPSVIEPIQNLKVKNMGNRNPLLHIDEILIALAICAVSDTDAAKALEQLPKLRGLDAHSSVMLSNVDERTFKKLGVNLTCEPKSEMTNRLYF